ncbi:MULTISPECIES: diacylglycerol kinase family protein [Carnobacterium]|uniref:UDP kinase n=2 Tax=Carnobacterium inhibens TaxID=147709 RepID=U5S9J0_9LACT|nr:MULTISPECIES: diacylglycerol kinase family protein [Carnobacterium]AGY81696.1 UDP kinase [Carnobacterium inhibens subsp. gilichinskyi]MBC9824852.1 UDP kinase [Carnobacterium inhibens]MCM3512534.1 diacylglycerol kinase family protein [Carnobacterium inhibens]MDN5372458.1 undecaprenol kinase [Carnobacterium sp.]
MDLKDKDQVGKNSSFFDSFKYAFKGVLTAFQEERNMRSHILIGSIVLILCAFLDLTVNEWLWVLFSIFLVVIMEIWNTVIENVVDLVTGDIFHPLAKKAKDMAASAVLLTAGFSIIVALIIILPKLWQILF